METAMTPCVVQIMQVALCPGCGRVMACANAQRGWAIVICEWEGCRFRGVRWSLDILSGEGVNTNLHAGKLRKVKCPHCGGVTEHGSEWCCTTMMQQWRDMGLEERNKFLEANEA